MSRSLLLGGTSFQPLYAPDIGAGVGGAGAGGAGADGAGTGQQNQGGASGAGNGAGGAGAGGAGASGAGGSAGGAGGPAGGGGQGGQPAGGAASAAGGTFAGSGGGTPPPGAPQNWPDNWRGLFAGDDKAALKDLEKYTEPNAVYKALRGLQSDVSSGKLKAPAQPLPANATAEQIADFKKANGLPEKAEAYVEKIALPNGHVIGETDKSLVGEFAKMANARNWSQDQFNDAVAWYYDGQARAEAQRQAADGDHKTEAARVLGAEWGAADYKTNMNAFSTLLAGMPEDARDLLLSARTVDGRLIGNLPGFIKWAAAYERQVNPAATIVAAGDGNAAKTIGDEIATIEKSMYDDKGNPNAAYWKGEAGQKMQARYRELVHAQSQMSGKGRAA
jgi:hypothetical protein